MTFPMILWLPDTFECFCIKNTEEWEIKQENVYNTKINAIIVAALLKMNKLNALFEKQKQEENATQKPVCESRDSFRENKDPNNEN